MRIAALTVLLLCLPAQAQSTAHRLEYQPVRDFSLLGGGLLVLGLTEIAFKEELAPRQCRWCGTSEPGIDRSGRDLRWSTAEKQEDAAMWSNIVLIGALPVAVLGVQAWGAHDAGDIKTVGLDTLIIAQSVVLSATVNQAVKFAVGRERPFVAALPPDEKARTDSPEDNNLSFFSAHTSNAFSMVVSAGTVATLRDYEHRWLIWAIGLPLAASTGYFRIAADKHYVTDVLVGAAMGSAVGLAVPLLLHPRTGTQTTSLSLQTTPSSISLAGTF